MVKRSRSEPMPALDRMDRQLLEALRVYRDCIDDVARLLRTAVGLELKWLFPIEVASEDVQQLASDAESCMCSNTRELWERQNRKTPWRVKRGLGPCCYSSWAAADRPDIKAWLRANRSSDEKEQVRA